MKASMQALEIIMLVIFGVAGNHVLSRTIPGGLNEKGSPQQNRQNNPFPSIPSLSRLPGRNEEHITPQR
jgi:hypothetical protein